MRTYSTKICLVMKKAITVWCDFSDVKSSKMLSFYLVALPDLPSPFGQKFQFCLLAFKLVLLQTGYVHDSLSFEGWLAMYMLHFPLKDG